MRILRNPVMRESKKPLIAMLIIAIFMFIISVFDFSLIFYHGTVALTIESVGILSSALSIIPITWAVCSVLLMKTKKVVFAKMPCYVISIALTLAFIIYYISAGTENIVQKILVFSVVVLAIYPFIIATLTLEGRVYNRVFATIFSSILLVISVVGAIILYVISSEISLLLLFPALTYIELIIVVLQFRLEKIKKSDKEKEIIITH